MSVPPIHPHEHHLPKGVPRHPCCELPTRDVVRKFGRRGPRLSEGGGRFSVDGRTTAGRDHPRRPRELPVQGRRRPGHLRRQGQVAASAPVELLRRTPRTCTPAPPRWCHGRVGRVDPGPQRGRGAHVGVLASSSSTGRGSTSGWSTTRATRSWPSPCPTSGPGPWSCGAGAARASATSVRTRHAYAIRETLDLLLRTFPIRTCSDAKLERHQKLGPAVPAVPHREVLGPVRRRDRPRLVRRRWSSELHGVPRGRHRAGVQAARGARWPTAAEALEFEQAARLRDRLATRAPGHREPADGGRPQRGPRRHRHRRGRARGGGAGVLRAQGPGGGSARLRAGQGHGPVAGPEVEPRSWSSSTATSRRSAMPKQVLVPTLPEDARALRAVADRAAGEPGRDPGPAAGRQAAAGRDGHPQRDRGVHPSPAAPGVGPQQPGPGAQRAAGVPRPAGGAAAHRVLRHEPHPGHRLRRLDGRARRTACPTSASTGGSR